MKMAGMKPRIMNRWLVSMIRETFWLLVDGTVDVIGDIIMSSARNEMA